MTRSTRQATPIPLILTLIVAISACTRGPEKPGVDWKTWSKAGIELSHPPGWTIEVNDPRMDFFTVSVSRPVQGRPVQVLGLYIGGHPDFPLLPEIKHAELKRKKLRLGRYQAELIDGDQVGRPGTAEGLIELGGGDAFHTVHFWFRDLDTESRKQVESLLASIGKR